MKTYNVKYDVGQKVFVLLSKKAIETEIQKIRITEQCPANWVNAPSNEMQDGKDGISIEYLVQVDYDSSNKIMNGQGVFNFDWVNQRDIYLTKEELILHII